jgi:ABC-type Mn2+/Zn2+ transport system ATPase subunit
LAPRAAPAEIKMNNALITLDNLAVGYEGQAVLSGISLAVARGSFTALLGANGTGKSTLLKTLLGLLPPVGGKIQIGRGRRETRFWLCPAGDAIRSAVSAHQL